MRNQNEAIRVVLSKILRKEIKSLNTASIKAKDSLMKVMEYYNNGNPEDLGTFVGAEKFRNFLIDCIDNKDEYKKIEHLPELQDMLKEEIFCTEIPDGHCFFELPKDFYLDTVDHRKWYTNSLLVQIEQGYISITYPAITEEGCNFGNLGCKKEALLEKKKLADLFEDGSKVISIFTSLEQAPSLKYLLVLGIYHILKRNR